MAVRIHAVCLGLHLPLGHFLLWEALSLMMCAWRSTDKGIQHFLFMTCLLVAMKLTLLLPVNLICGLGGIHLGCSFL